MYIYEMTILDSKSFYHVDICFICAADKSDLYLMINVHLFIFIISLMNYFSNRKVVK